jgi:hypothetical protein
LPRSQNEELQILHIHEMDDIQRQNHRSFTQLQNENNLHRMERNKLDHRVDSLREETSTVIKALAEKKYQNDQLGEVTSTLKNA